MRTFYLTVAFCVLLAPEKRSTSDAYISPIYSSRSYSSVRLNAADVDITTAINTVMRSTPPPHIPDESVIRHTSLLVSLWNQIAFANTEGNEEEVDFKLTDYGLTRKDVKGFIAHFQTCKDCAADNAFLMATQDDAGEDVLRLSNVHFSVLTEVDSDSDW